MKWQQWCAATTAPATTGRQPEEQTGAGLKQNQKQYSKIPAGSTASATDRHRLRDKRPLPAMQATACVTIGHREGRPAV